ncbi:MAG: DUF4279 domain-containing protein [Planctomycetia bacterium]|nr:DUF4279 domain-containing protein [Planctomycetia bacterium]
MNQISLSSEQSQTDVHTHIDFCVRSDRLRLDEISQRLRMQPTHGFEPRDRFLATQRVGEEIRTIERRRPPYGTWHFRTEGLVLSESLLDHAEFLLTNLEPAAEAIRELISDSEYTVGIICWHVGPSGFQLPSPIFARLAALSEWISFTCWETNDHVEESEE